jgi:signal transduction histidine kinase
MAEIKPVWLTLGSGLAILLVGLYGSWQFFARRDLPPPYDDRHPLDRARIAAVDGAPIETPRDIQFALWRASIGRPVSLEVREKDGTVSSVTGRIIAFRGGSAPFIDLFIAVFTWGLSLVTLLYKRNDRFVRIFFWLCTAFGFSVAVQGETYALGTAWTTLLPGLCYIVFTALGPAFLLHFFSLFPGKTRSRNPFLLYVPAMTLAAVFCGILASAYVGHSLKAFHIFEDAYFILRIYMIAYLLAAIVRLARIRRRAQDDDVKAQAQWVFFGLTAGMVPFLFFFELPKALLGKAVLSENLTAVFFLVIPATLAIAIVKHRLFDVEVVINRSLVYSLLTITTAGLYLLVIQILQEIFSSDRKLFSVIAVFAAAAAFHPAQRRIQDLVDRAFFRQKYDYRKAVLAFGRQAQLAAGREELLDMFLSALRTVWAPDKAGVFVHDRPREDHSVQDESAVHRGDAFDESVFSRPQCIPGLFWARRNAVRSADDVSFAEETALAANGLELALPLALPGAATCGWLVLGRKRSDERFSREDLSLLRTLAGEMMTNLDRVRLQEEVIYERASKEKLDELNRLKTEFISTVSHELRTPMSSIQGVAELLQSGKIRDRDQREKFLTLMVSESGRLSRFLHNVLDFGRIEQDVKSYRLSPVSVQNLVREAVDAFGLLLDSQGASVRVKAPAEPLIIEGDEDALKQALMNLIDNAIKYSPVDKNVDINVLERDEDVEIRLADSGIGIAPEDQPRIFERFYRTAEAGIVSPRGAGLGLKIVKHIVEAHGGTILLESEVGRGSVFRLIFPKRGKA